MGRLIAIFLGGAALAFFIPSLLEAELPQVVDLWKRILPGPWYDRVKANGAGIFTGLALVLLAVRGRD